MAEAILPALPAPAEALASITDWYAVQSLNGQRWITYRRFTSEAEAIVLARLIAHEWASLGPWRVAHLAERVVWEGDAENAQRSTLNAQLPTEEPATA